MVAWPGVVDQDDLDARLVNAIPALGVALALGLTVAARRAGWGVAAACRSTACGSVAVVVLVLSIPWIAASSASSFPTASSSCGVSRPDTDGLPIAAVHLGHHHGFDGALVALSALLLSRPRLRRATARGDRP